MPQLIINMEGYDMSEEWMLKCRLFEYKDIIIYFFIIMNITHNIIPVSPLSKETLQKYKNDMEAQVRINMMKDWI